MSVLALAMLALAPPANAKIKKANWGETKGRQKVSLYILDNGALTARIATYGGMVVDLSVPDAAASAPISYAASIGLKTTFSAMSACMDRSWGATATVLRTDNSR